MGRVVELLPGKDGKTRCVRVLRPDRSEGVYTIKLLYPLELAVTPSCEQLDAQLDIEQEGIRVLPRRAAADKCLQRLKSSN